MKARKVEGPRPERAAARQRRRGSSRTRLEELRAFAETALEPPTPATAQHDMRIAAKRLRYVLEIIGPCFGAEAEAARGAAKELQTVLGDIHDCDLMLPKVEGIESLRRPAANAPRAALPRLRTSSGRPRRARAPGPRASKRGRYARRRPMVTGMFTRGSPARSQVFPANGEFWR